jgi:lysophospholipase L1-like esterase
MMKKLMIWALGVVLGGILLGCNGESQMPLGSASESTTLPNTEDVVETTTVPETDVKVETMVTGETKVKKIVFFGDSVTEGCFELSYSNAHGDVTIIRDKKSVYHNILKERIEKEHPGLDLEFVNAGISGNSSADGIKRMNRDVIAKKPDIVVVCFGLNDVAGMSLKEYVSNMEQIFRTLKDRGIHVIYMTPNMYNTYVHGDVLPSHADMAATLAKMQTENRPDTYYAEAMKKAEECGCVVVNAYGAWKKLSEYGVDVTELLSNRLNHPTRAMHRLFADLLYDEIIDLIV